jgi:prepilin-type N-terminal cleavage/methylation domain-containing protein
MATCRITGGAPYAQTAPGLLRRRGAFSLVELVVVVVIIGIVSAIAVPRFSRSSRSATANDVAGSVVNVRRGIELYYAEHGRYPGYVPGSSTPSGTWFVDQLLEYSDETGNTQTSFGYPVIYGPYMRAPFPVNPFNDLDTVKVKATPGEAHALGTTGWVAVLSNGDFGINATAAETAELGTTPVEDEAMRINGDTGL